MARTLTQDESNIVDNYLLEQANNDKNKTIQQMRDEIDKLFGLSTSHETIRVRRKKLLSSLDETQENIELAKESEKNILEITDDYYIFYIQEEDIYGNKKTVSKPIKISTVDEIFKHYSKHGYNHSSERILQDFKLDNQLWYTIKRRLRLFKDSHVVSPATLEKFENDPKWLKRYIDWVIDESIQDKYKHQFVESFNRKMEKDYKYKSRVLANADNFWHYLRRYLVDYNPTLNIIQRKNIEENWRLTVWLSDLHLGKQNTNDIILRIRKTTNYLLNRQENQICIAWLGDWLETVVVGWMHPWQVEKMEKYGFDLMMLVVDEITNMLVSLYQWGKNVWFYELWGNHDRISKDNKEDLERTVALFIFELIKANVKQINEIVVNIFHNNINTFQFWQFNYIVSHWEDNFDKRKPTDIAWKHWIIWVKNIIIHWHKHNISISEDKDITMIWLPALAWKGDYDTRMDLHSESWIVIVKENEDDLPDIYIKRWI